MSEFLDYEDIVPELYYAITINSDGIITGRHESKEPINSLQFYETPWLHGDIIRGVSASSHYAEGTHIDCYTEDGIYRGLIWAIENGYEKLPEGYEIVDGEIRQVPMVESNIIPETSAPPEPTEPMPDYTPTLTDYAVAIEEQSHKIAVLEELIKRLLPTDVDIEGLLT